ncbi:MAG: hypothetical protein KK926_01380 [Methanomethylovorans sp.]|nr:hypothetical protein [Methanomethylovorans sp.]
MNKKYGFRHYNVLDRRQFNLLMWNMMKSLSNSSEHVPSSSPSCRNDTK